MSTPTHSSTAYLGCPRRMRSCSAPSAQSAMSSTNSLRDGGAVMLKPFRARGLIGEVVGFAGFRRFMDGAFRA